MEGINQVPMALHHLLDSSNLILYESALLDQGADDVDQLVGLTGEEFQQLCSMIGMDKKPFHVMRFKKALEKHSTNSNNSVTPPPSKPIPIQTSSHSNVSITPTPMIGNSSSLMSPSIPANQIVPMPEPKSDPPPLTLNHHLHQEASVTLFLPPYLHPDSDTSDFSPLVDYQTPVQKTLNSPPCRPGTWDPKRKSIIRKYASIYGRNLDRRQKEVLSPFEEHVNEAAYQLCLRDPTLMVRRDELFLLSKRAVKQGGYTYCEGVVAKAPTTGSASPVAPRKRSWESTLSSSTSPSVMDSTGVSSTSIIRLSQSKRFQLDTSQRLSTKERVNRMYSLQAQIEVNKALQREKVAAMEEAKQSGNFSKSFNLQLEVESLGIECQELENMYALLKRKQARSNRYFRDKVKHQSESVSDDNPGAQSPTDELTEDQPPDMMEDSTVGEEEEGPLVLQAKGTQSEQKRVTKRKATPHKVMITVVKGGNKSSAKDSTEESGIKDLVDNVTNATDQLNSLIRTDYSKELNW